MSFLFRYVWAAKVCLTGWSTYKVCHGENGNEFICVISASYFLILFLASLVTCKGLPKPREIDALEGEYLRRLEEGITLNDKQE